VRERVKAFFEQPGVTPGRVAPIVGVVLVVPALFVGTQIQPLGQDPAAYDQPTIVTRAAAPAPAPAPVATTPSDSSPTSSDTSPSSDTSSGDTSSSGSSDTSTTTDTSTPDTTTPDTSTPDTTTPDTSTPDTTTPDPTADPDTTEKYSGTVVRANAHAKSYTLATRDQSLIPIHADDLPQVGDTIKAAVGALSNGTYKQAEAPTTVDPPAKISFRGYVTWGGPASFVVSNPGASIPVGTPAGSTAALPALGSAVLVEVTLDAATGALTAVADPTVEGAPTDAPLHIETVVQKVDADTVTLSADDLRETKADIVAKRAAADLDLSVLAEGQAIDATVVIAADGTYTLTGWSDDSDATAAADPDKAAGDQVLAKPSETVRPWVDRVLAKYGFAGLTR
jgi:hypothetical protein